MTHYPHICLRDPPLLSQETQTTLPEAKKQKDTRPLIRFFSVSGEGLAH